MSRFSSPQALMPSLLDRLLDPESMGTEGRPGYTLQQMIDAVRADLEDLLNTRQPHRVTAAEYAELSSSIFTYGLPDFTAFDASSAPAQEAIGRTLEALITQFEPRLRNIRATLVKPSEGGDPRIRFHIDAELAVDPAPEVGFETVVELMTGKASIKASTE